MALTGVPICQIWYWRTFYQCSWRGTQLLPECGLYVVDSNVIFHNLGFGMENLYRKLKMNRVCHPIPGVIFVASFQQNTNMNRKTWTTTRNNNLQNDYSNAETDSLCRSKLYGHLSPIIRNVIEEKLVEEKVILFHNADTYRGIKH